jgi:membrane protein CcdC involved in cytochrome C biogenesis
MKSRNYILLTLLCIALALKLFMLESTNYFEFNGNFYENLFLQESK